MPPNRIPNQGALRPSALAGRWYPGDPDALRRAVHGYLDDAAGDDVLPDVRAILSPHAGYIYSGPMAGRAFAAARGRPYARAVLVGPAHRVAFHGVSAGDFEAYETPLGPVRVDRAAIAELIGRHPGLVGCHPAAHAEEHCIEIMLPFLREAVGDVPILPLLVGHASPDDVQRVLDATLRDDDLLIISSDLSHFEPYDDAARRDRATLASVIAGDVDHLGGYDACGYKGVAAAVALSRERGWRRSLLGYQSSGDTAGDRGSVVGYGAVAFGR